MVKIKHISGIIAVKDEKLIPKENFGRHSNGTEWFYFETQEEKDKFYEDNFPQSNELELFKESINELIDQRTVSNIFKGFNFDNNIFSMSLSAQINLSNLFNIPEEAFPLPYSTLDNDVYILQFADRQNFYLSALTFKNTTIQEGNSLKQQVKNATTIEELNTIKTSL